MATTPVTLPKLTVPTVPSLSSALGSMVSSAASTVANAATGGTYSTIRQWWNSVSTSGVIMLVIGLALVILALLTFAFSEVFSADTLRTAAKGTIKDAAAAAVA